jgi:hypothetical protein
MKTIVMVVIMIATCWLLSRLIDKWRSREMEERRQKEYLVKQMRDPAPHSIFWCTPDINPLNDITGEGLWIPDYEAFVPESLLNKIMTVTLITHYGNIDLKWIKAGQEFFETMTSTEDGLLIEDNLFVSASEIKTLKKTRHVVLEETNGK